MKKENSLLLFALGAVSAVAAVLVCLRIFPCRKKVTADKAVDDARAAKDKSLQESENHKFVEKVREDLNKSLDQAGEGFEKGT
jgi:hypothetical protein